jgi:DNA-binding NtrC family response regulator
MKKILIVDDEEVIIDFLSYEFNHCGFQVHTANSGNLAISILKNSKVDIVLSDVRMKDGNGYDLLAYVNSNKLKVAFYFMSADLNISKDDFQKHQIEGFFAKPFNIEDMLNTLK